MTSYNYKSATIKLRKSAGNIRCSEMKKILEDLGFEVADGTRGNHKTFKHPKIPSFAGGNYDCGHGKDAQIKRFYINSVLDTIEQHEKELTT